jgi:hypothetical protein
MSGVVEWVEADHVTKPIDEEKHEDDECESWSM